MSQLIKTKKIVILTLFLASTLFGFLVGTKIMMPAREKERKTPAPSVSVLNENQSLAAEFEVEIASTRARQQKGLMFREYLGEDKGMLFIFEKEQPLSFWMKNTLIPLDIIYISQDKKIVSIAKNVQPCKVDPCPGYASGAPAQYVLEINGGLSDKLGIAEEMPVEFSLP